MAPNFHLSESQIPSNGHRGLWPCPNPTTSLVSLPVAAPLLTRPGPRWSLGVAWTCGAARTSLCLAQPYPRGPSLQSCVTCLDHAPCSPPHRPYHPGTYYF